MHTLLYSHFRIAFYSASVFVAHCSVLCAIEEPAASPEVRIIYEQEMGAAKVVDQLFDISNEHLILARVTPQYKMVVQVIDLNDRRVSDELTFDQVAGCELARTLTGDKIGVLLGKFTEGLTIESTIFEFREDTFSRISLHWRFPKRAPPVGWVGGESAFAAVYHSTDLIRYEYIVETLDLSGKLKTEGSVRIDPVNTALLAYVQESGITVFKEDNAVTIYQSRGDRRLTLLQKIPDVTAAAVSLDGQSIAIHDGVGIHIYESPVVDGESPFRKTRSYEPFKEEKIAISVSRTGQFVLAYKRSKCWLYDKIDPNSVREFVIPGTEEWSVSDDGNWLSAVYRTKSADSDDNTSIAHIRILDLKHER